jgi:hypothetical protein
MGGKVDKKGENCILQKKLPRLKITIEVLNPPSQGNIILYTSWLKIALQLMEKLAINCRARRAVKSMQCCMPAIKKLDM